MKMQPQKGQIIELSSLDTEIFSGWNALKEASSRSQIEEAESQIFGIIIRVVEAKRDGREIPEYPEKEILIDQGKQDFLFAAFWRQFKNAESESDELIEAVDGLIYSIANVSRGGLQRELSMERDQNPDPAPHPHFREAPETWKDYQVRVGNTGTQSFKSRHDELVERVRTGEVSEAELPQRVAELFTPRGSSVEAGNNLGMERSPEGATSAPETWDELLERGRKEMQAQQNDPTRRRPDRNRGMEPGY